MMQLVHACGHYWHWVERDLLALGFRADDIGTEKLTLWELISIVVAAPPGSACYEKMPNWSRTDQLLANLSEQSAGVLQLTGRYPRPGISAAQPQSRSAATGYKPVYGVEFEPMSKEEFIAKRQRYMKANQAAAQRNPELARKKAQPKLIDKGK